MEYKKILLSCGELSGEIHSANLIKELKKITKNNKYYAIGSRLLKEQGCRILIDYHEISLIGFMVVIKKYFFIKKRINLIKKFIRTEKPELVILVDFPGFNFIIARYAKKFNIKTIYYLPPQIWAWNYKRIEKIRKYIDLVIPMLPFEEKIYKKEKIKYSYNGHPLIDNIKVTLSKKAFYKKYKIPSDKKIIMLLPGSREFEVHHNTPYLLGTARQLNKKYNDLFFVMNIASTIDQDLIKNYIKKYDIRNLISIEKQNYNLFNASHAGLLVSGTVALEAAYFKLPMTIIYKVDMLFYFLWKYFLVKVKFVSLVNLIPGRQVVREILQNDLTVDNLTEEADRLIMDKKYRKKMIFSLGKVKQTLGKKGVIKKIALKVKALLRD